MKKYYIIVFFFFVFIFNCFSQQKYKLRFDGFYYWDNKKDTTIKANDAFKKNFIDATSEDGTWEDAGVTPPVPDKVTFYMPGSRYIDLYCFYEDGTYIASFMGEGFNMEKAKKRIDGNRADNVRMGIKNKYTLKGNQVYFEQDWSKGKTPLEYEGKPWPKPLKIMFTGTIMEDSIRIVITSTFPPGQTPLFGGSDTVRVCRFVPFK